MKIAVTTKDGVKVNEHFGKAENFYIYEISKGELNAIEKRKVAPYCANVNGIPDDQDHSFSVDKLTMIYDAIKDCKVLYTQQIGDKPKEELIQLGMTIKLCNCSIESIVGCNGDCK